MSLFRVTTSRLLSSISSSSFHANISNVKLNSSTPNRGGFLGVIRNPNQRFMSAVALVGASQQLNNSFNQQNNLPNKVKQYSGLQSYMIQSSTMARLIHNSTMTAPKNRRSIITRDITKNMTFFTECTDKIEWDSKTLTFKKPTGNPLVLIMSWLLAKQKHLRKYAEIYTELGFDVLVVHITPWQLLWPTKGTQLVAADTLKFLENNSTYAPIVVHGFSVGAYQFGEMMLMMSRDMKRYQPILDRMISQVWDSAADITEIPVGLPKSIFPKNPRMESALRNYVMYHLKTFHNQATVHYMRSSQMFHSTLLKAPALFLVSKNDVIGPESSNRAVTDNWERANIKVEFKCWENSLHAAHYIRHRDEYLSLLFKHLEYTGVFENSSVKSRAKL
ncbi:uncharacterized protein LOC129951408 isoform X1 [Eupeodes corollae]|uniref:uncharacterized protein LOC129951408 isoform X1 n=1 Tax=Eupeodes corollae TaxID=290404 RepID=UPI002491DCA7|nr:uncharacterized protein LOC129951408 isoform X1 [Eupeodes corollae]